MREPSTGVLAGDLGAASVRSLGLDGVVALLQESLDGIVVCRAADRRYVYANPAACRLLGLPLHRLLGQDLLRNFPEREHPAVLSRFADQLNGHPGVWTVVAALPDGRERQLTWSTMAIDANGERLAAAVFRDTTELRGAVRHAAGLAQAAAAAAAGGDLQQMLDELAEAGLAATSALAVALDLVDEDKVIRSGGRAGVPPGYPQAITESSALGARVPDIEQLYAGRPIVFPDGRSLLSRDSRFAPLLAALEPLPWRACMYVFMTYRGVVVGDVAAYFPAQFPGPTEEELSFFVALADHAAVAVANARLLVQADAAAALRERTRLARELHDSVSQALFSMTMHTRAAEKSLAKAEVRDEWVTKALRDLQALRELTSSALTEMRALIFELHPDALSDEGLVAGLRRQTDALTARAGIPVSTSGPAQRLPLTAEREEQLYRIALEALHNAVKHAQATAITATVTEAEDVVQVRVADDGVGFAPLNPRAGHLGMRTMRERAARVGGDVVVQSRPGAGTTVTATMPVPVQAEPRHA